MINHSARTIILLCLGLAACDGDTSSASNNVRADAAADSGQGKQENQEDQAGSRADAARADAGTDAGKADGGSVQRAGQQRVALRFSVQLGDEPFACGRSYAQQGSTGQTIALRDFRMFVQDVALVDADGREVPVQLDARDPWQTPEVALLDFEDNTGECAGSDETNYEITGAVPEGEYRALRFSHGVPEQLNHADPKTFPAPLRTPGMSWNWLLGLRFVRLEVGSADVDSDLDAGAASGSFSLHVGSTGCAGNPNAGTIKCAKPNRSRVELQGFELGKSEIVLDVRPLLSGSDLRETIECHSGTAVCDPLFEALGVDYASGQAGAMQRVFRLQ